MQTQFITPQVYRVLKPTNNSIVLMPDLLVNVIFRCLDLWNSFWVSDEPEDLITGEGECHEDEQGLKQFREWGRGREAELKQRFSTTCKEGWTNFAGICLLCCLLTTYLILLIMWPKVSALLLCCNFYLRSQKSRLIFQYIKKFLQRPS